VGASPAAPGSDEDGFTPPLLEPVPPVEEDDEEEDELLELDVDDELDDDVEEVLVPPVLEDVLLEEEELLLLDEDDDEELDDDEDPHGSVVVPGSSGHWSHASPALSPSALAWEGLGSSGQLSAAPHTPSASGSTPPRSLQSWMMRPPVWRARPDAFCTPTVRGPGAAPGSTENWRILNGIPDPVAPAPETPRNVMPWPAEKLPSATESTPRPSTAR
jgi:hypothetical protein